MINRDFQAPVRPASVQQKTQFPGMFPFDAFAFDAPSETAPDLIIQSPWNLKSEDGSYLNYQDLDELSSLDAADEMPIWDQSTGTYKRVTLATLKAWITA